MEIQSQKPFRIFYWKNLASRDENDILSRNNAFYFMTKRREIVEFEIKSVFIKVIVKFQKPKSFVVDKCRMLIFVTNLDQNSELSYNVKEEIEEVIVDKLSKHTL